ncbi:MAG: hypothetical protein EU532_09780 [Promethearchaeota archaeon]|nr:MAG: hypothetical protein EU532_09780 [Candidatus Lokiarchaeota archaeon]
MPRRKQKVKYSRKLACQHLNPKGDISNSLQPLCYCPERDLILGTRAYVCQVCYLYNPRSNVSISEIYAESKKTAEKQIKEKKLALENIEIEDIEIEEDVDLSIDEFEEEEEIQTKYEKRKAGKGDLEEGEEEFAEVECPFCGELFDDLASHIRDCEFAPDDVDIEDYLPSRPKKSRRKKKKTEKKGTAEKPEKEEEKGQKDKKECPYCGKNFVRLGRHLKACPKRPDDADEEKEAKFLDGEIDSI